jgi:glycosyltransferase involved in cell wall biosynthesis
MRRIPAIISVFDLEAKKHGSMEDYALFLSRSLRDRGWKNILVFVRNVKPEIHKLFSDAGAVVEVIPKGGQPGCYVGLTRLLWRYRGDIVHYHFFEHFSLLPILGLLPHPRLQVFTDHFRQPHIVGWRIRSQCVLWDRLVFGALGVRILAVSEYVKNTLVNCYRIKSEHITVVANGVNLERFKPGHATLRDEICRELGVPAGTALIISASDLRPGKGIEDLVIAAESVVAERPNTLFLIIGEGSEWQALHQRTAERGLQRFVRFAGLRSDVHRFMAGGDVVVVPSVWQEPAGLVVIEGMAVGRPVVATRVGGIPEYLEDGVTGILVEPRAPLQLSKALLRLLHSPAEAEAMGRAGRARVEARFSIERWVQDTVRIYETALGAE